MTPGLEETENLVGQLEGRTYAFFRLPDALDFTFIAQDDAKPDVALTLMAADEVAGYVVAPFHVGPETPVVFIRPDRVLRLTYPQTASRLTVNLRPASGADSWRKAYGESFTPCLNALRSGRFDKLVLSRRADYLPSGALLHPLRLFLTACQAYPHQYVALWSTPVTGCWLTATPEKLLSGSAAGWQTMSLAGTMVWDADSANPDLHAWSAKNRHEQQVVTDYLQEQLAPVASALSIGSPHPVRAAGVAHLRTDIRFTCSPDWTTGRLLERLHPTPAVCGQPRREAGDFLRKTEPHSRRYYAGFSGPLHLEGECALYVSLRCMEIEADAVHCYAGGGLLSDSCEESEWRETQRKLRTMLDLFETP